MDCLAPDAATAPNNWEAVFSSRTWGRYPPEALIRFHARHLRDLTMPAVLELGCGAGANLWFLDAEGCSTFGVDASLSAVRQAHDRLKGMGQVAHATVGDVRRIDRMFAPSTFDAIVDICCLNCLSLFDAKFVVHKAHELLKPGGKVFSMLLADGTTAPLAGPPGTLFTRDEVELMFGGFSHVSVERMSVTHQGAITIHWLTTATKERGNAH